MEISNNNNDKLCNFNPGAVDKILFPLLNSNFYNPEIKILIFLYKLTAFRYRLVAKIMHDLPKALFSIDETPMVHSGLLKYFESESEILGQSTL